MMKLGKIYTCKQCKNGVLFDPNLLKKAVVIDSATMYRAPTTVVVPPLRGSSVRRYKTKRQVKRKNKKKIRARKRKTNVRKLITKILKT